eukprot:gnl/TRDRNA2_/TRDRNA2_171453_c0_seq2.p1 gnl/TRDRNA2_/TRDRNA2_171453_c0~~gnl/TRDRNA2_/TRDRNA2_171453_c0_seq2.p1  ORF type:complete len:339 (+),score=13.83 gnl/TRDRNA2_/TRDRNA2_171453_c0_seq2:43-1059(+)
MFVLCMSAFAIHAWGLQLPDHVTGDLAFLDGSHSLEENMTGVTPANDAVNTSSHLPDSCHDTSGLPSMWIGVCSSPSNFDNRANVRKYCFPAYRRAGFDFQFIVGHPSDPTRQPDSRRQDRTSTEFEKSISLLLSSEIDTWGDIAMVPMRDTYQDLTDKVIALFKYGLQHTNTRLLAKVDDDTCLDPKLLQKLHEQRTVDQTGTAELYAGMYLWNGTEQAAMKGADGTIAPYQAGPIEILSRKLAHAIFEDASNYQLLYQQYGTQSEDANMGKWVQHIKKNWEGRTCGYVRRRRFVPRVGLPGDSLLCRTFEDVAGCTVRHTIAHLVVESRRLPLRSR